MHPNWQDSATNPTILPPENPQMKLLLVNRKVTDVVQSGTFVINKYLRKHQNNYTTTMHLRAPESTSLTFRSVPPNPPFYIITCTFGIRNWTTHKKKKKKSLTSERRAQPGWCTACTLGTRRVACRILYTWPCGHTLRAHSRWGNPYRFCTCCPQACQLWQDWLLCKDRQIKHKIG